MGFKMDDLFKKKNEATSEQIDSKLEEEDEMPPQIIFKEFQMETDMEQASISKLYFKQTKKMAIEARGQQYKHQLK